MNFGGQTSPMPPIQSFCKVVAIAKPLVEPSIITPMHNSINIYRSNNLANMKLRMQ
jgi:hypothetical protein